MARAANLHPLSVAWAARGGLHYLLVAAQVLRSERIALVAELRRGAHRRDRAALDTCPRSEIDYPVGDAHRSLIVFHDDDSVALVAEVEER